MMFCPAYCHSIAAPAANLIPLVIGGLGVMWFGLILESVADWQKMAAKAVAPDAFVSNGVWKFRCCTNSSPAAPPLTVAMHHHRRRPPLAAARRS